MDKIYNDVLERFEKSRAGDGFRALVLEVAPEIVQDLKERVVKFVYEERVEASLTSFAAGTKSGHEGGLSEMREKVLAYLNREDK